MIHVQVSRSINRKIQGIRNGWFIDLPAQNTDQESLMFL